MVAVRKDFLKFNFESGARGGGGEKISHVFFTRIGMARRQERGVYAR